MNRALGIPLSKAATVQALMELGLDPVIDHVRDYAQIVSYGVMTTPALVYNGKVLFYGRALKAQEVKSLLKRSCKRCPPE